MLLGKVKCRKLLKKRLEAIKIIKIFETFYWVVVGVGRLGVI